MKPEVPVRRERTSQTRRARSSTRPDASATLLQPLDHQPRPCNELMLACFRCHARPVLRISVRAYAASARQSTPNDDIVAMLQECKNVVRHPCVSRNLTVGCAGLREYKKNKSMSKEQFEKRKIAVSLAIAVVREHNVPITSAEEARRLKRVGPSISKRIELFLAGDHVRQYPRSCRCSVLRALIYRTLRCAARRWTVPTTYSLSTLVCRA
jgi:hypothetical protein